jgi:hypothetical protein
MQVDTICMTGLSDVLPCISTPFLLVIVAIAIIAAFSVCFISSFLFLYFLVSLHVRM